MRGRLFSVTEVVTPLDSAERKLNFYQCAVLLCEPLGYLLDIFKFRNPGEFFGGVGGEFAAQAEPENKAVHHFRAEVYQKRREGETSLMAKGIFGTAANQSKQQCE